MRLEYGDLLVCINRDDPHFLQVGVVSDKDIKNFDTEVVFAQGKNISEK